LGIKRLIDEFAMTHEKAANAVGRSRVAVSNLLRLLTLAGGVQVLLMENKLDMGHARALIGLEPVQQVMLANKIMQGNLSVREVEKLVRQADKVAEPKPAQAGADQDVLSLQNTLSEKLGTGVMITAKANGTGTLKINYSNLDELEGFIKKITH
jgi:ParB family chromosome partitioning protein